jgi:hypothetical protein
MTKLVQFFFNQVFFKNKKFINILNFAKWEANLCIYWPLHPKVEYKTKNQMDILQLKDQILHHANSRNDYISYHILLPQV